MIESHQPRKQHRDKKEISGNVRYFKTAQVWSMTVVVIKTWFGHKHEKKKKTIEERMPMMRSLQITDRVAGSQLNKAFNEFIQKSSSRLVE